MKRTILNGTWILALTASLSAAEGTIRYDSLPTGSEMMIVGTATGHDWKVKGVIISGFFEAEAAWGKDLTLKSVAGLGEGKTPPNCEVHIPIKSLKSQVAVGRSIMDNRMIKEMKGTQFPSIDYKLTQMKVKGEAPASGSPVEFDTKGRLALAGVTNEVTFPIKMERVGQDQLKFTGAYKTKMTAFGIQPPEFTILGIGSKTGDDITLTWTWMTGVKAGAK